MYCILRVLSIRKHGRIMMGYQYAVYSALTIHDVIMDVMLCQTYVWCLNMYGMHGCTKSMLLLWAVLLD